MDEIVDVLEEYEDSHGNHPIAAIDVRDGSVNLRPQPRPKWRPMEDEDEVDTADDEGPMPPQEEVFRRLQEKMDRKAGKKKKRSEQRIANSITDAGAGKIEYGGPRGAADAGSFFLDGSLDLETMLGQAGVSAQHAAELGLDTLDPTDPRVEHALARLAHAVRSGDKDRATSRGRRDRPRSGGDLALEELVGMVAAQPADEESVVRREVQRAAAARRATGLGSAAFGAAPPPMSEREMQIRMRARKALRNKGQGGGDGDAQHRLRQAEWAGGTRDPGLSEDGDGGEWRSGPRGRGAENNGQGQGQALDPVAAYTAKEKAQYKARMEAQREVIQRAEGACLRGKVASGKGGKAAAAGGGGMQVRVHGATGGSGGGRRGQDAVKVRLPGGSQHRDKQTQQHQQRNKRAANRAGLQLPQVSMVSVSREERVRACQTAGVYWSERAGARQARAARGAIDMAMEIQVDKGEEGEGGAGGWGEKEEENGTTGSTQPAGGLADMLLHRIAVARDSMRRDLDRAERALLQGCHMGDVGSCGGASMVQAKRTAIEAALGASHGNAQVPSGAALPTTIDRVRAVLDGAGPAMAMTGSLQAARRSAPQLLQGCKGGYVSACQKLQGLCDTGPAAAGLVASVQTEGFSGAPRMRGLAVQAAARRHAAQVHGIAGAGDGVEATIRRVYCTALRIAKGLPPQGIRSSAGLQAAKQLGASHSIHGGGSGASSSSSSQGWKAGSLGSAQDRKVLMDAMGTGSSAGAGTALARELQPWLNQYDPSTGYIRKDAFRSARRRAMQGQGTGRGTDEFLRALGADERSMGGAGLATRGHTGESMEQTQRRKGMRARVLRRAAGGGAGDGVARGGGYTASGGAGGVTSEGGAGGTDGQEYYRWARRVDRLAVGRNLFEAEVEVDASSEGKRQREASITRGRARARLEESVQGRLQKQAKEEERAREREERRAKRGLGPQGQGSGSSADRARSKARRQKAQSMRERLSAKVREKQQMDDGAGYYDRSGADEL